MLLYPLWRAFVLHIKDHILSVIKHMMDDGNKSA